MIHKLLIACTAWLFACGASAGTIAFELSLTGATLTVTSKGDSTAFYPAVFRLLADGRWERLAPAPATLPPAELLPGAGIALLWPEARAQQSQAAIERLRPLMVRFFDQAGVGFGQLSFMQTPAAAVDTVSAAYADGQLSVSPPSGGSTIRATWILWPQEEGIDPLRRPASFEHHQPPARRIEWHSAMGPLRLATGAARPAVVLVHETAAGLSLQNVARGVVQGRQQRSVWLDAQAPLYALAAVAAALAILAPVLLTRRARVRS
ncbi:MAG: hypothetical protein WCV99_01375 [Sterolibacterium sp.]|jgi:hypothetical protein